MHQDAGDVVTGEGGVVAVFAPDCTDARVVKRIRAFRDQGLEVVALTFRRQRYNRDFVPDWDNVDLGTISDRAYVKRLIGLMRALTRAIGQRGRLRQATAIYAINLDMALLAVVALGFGRHTAKLVYEVADIHGTLVAPGLQSQLLRWLERRILHRTALLTVTSPGFITHYFEQRQGLTPPWLLLENKLYPPVPEQRQDATATARPNRHCRWVIGYFGTLRCRASWDMMQQLAGTQVEFYLRGRPTRLDPEEFAAVLERCPGLRYAGEYRHPDDLAEIHALVDFAWAFELQDVQHNSRWLLPNRLYEAGAYGVPLLAPRGFVVGDLVEELGIGWTFPEPYVENLQSFFQTLTQEEYDRKAEAVRRIPRERFVSDDQHAALCRILRHED